VVNGKQGISQGVFEAFVRLWLLHGCFINGCSYDCGKSN